MWKEWIDRLFGKRAEKRRIATAIAASTHVLEECPVCRGYADKQVGEEVLAKADQVIDELFARNAPEIAIFAGDRDELKRLIRDVRNDYGYLCPCEDI